MSALTKTQTLLSQKTVAACRFRNQSLAGQHTNRDPVLLLWLEWFLAGDRAGPGLKVKSFLMLFLLLLHLQGHRTRVCMLDYSFYILEKVKSQAAYHLLQAAVLHSPPLIHQQPERLRLGRIQLLLLRQEHCVKVWQWLGLKLWNLQRGRTKKNK